MYAVNYSRLFWEKKDLNLKMYTFVFFMSFKILLCFKEYLCVDNATVLLNIAMETNQVLGCV